MEGSVNASGVKLGMVGRGVCDGEVGAGVSEASMSINEMVGRRRGSGVAVGMALCVSASVVLMVDMAVSIISASLIVGVD